MPVDVKAARVGDDLVLLELSLGEYELVADFFATAGEDRSRSATIEALGDARAEALEGWLAAGAPRPFAPEPSRCQEGEARPTGRDRLDFWAAWASLGPRYLTRPFAQLLVPPQTPSGAFRSSNLARRCQAFAALLPWAPFQGVCLYRAFFLRAFLARSGHAPRWVFGVRTWPFQAHCWLQEGDLVLNDDLERVKRFVPILVI